MQGFPNRRVLDGSILTELLPHSLEGFVPGGVGSRRADVIRKDAELNHAPVLFQRPEHFIGEVPRMVADGPGARMGGYHRSLGLLKNIVEGPVGDVGDVHHNAEFVHTVDYTPPRFAEPLVFGVSLISRRIGQIVVRSVGQGNVPDPPSIELVDSVDIEPQGIPVL